jgi:mRNA interferase RelE/StbE
METIPITEAKARIAELAERVAREHDHFTITRNGRADVMLISVAEYESMLDGPITTGPHRVGKPLDEPFDGYHVARRGTYRTIYRINEDKHTVEVHSIRHRRDAYHA